MLSHTSQDYKWRGELDDDEEKLQTSEAEAHSVFNGANIATGATPAPPVK